MGKYEKGAGRNLWSPRKLLVLSCVLLAVALAILAVSLGIMMGQESAPGGQAGQQIGKLVIESVEEQGDQMVVSTSYCQVKYPYAFSDLIQVEAVNEEKGAALVFFSVIEGVRTDLYTISFGGTADIQLGTLKVGADTVAVRAQICKADEKLDQELQYVFVAAQETFNDVVASLSENSSFTPVN